MTSTSGERPADEQFLVRYLLGELSEQEAERLDELSIADDEFAWRLRAAEDDLVDAYVRGELSGETLERFRTVYLVSPQRRQKVGFAGALLAYGQRNVAPASDARPETAASRLIPAAKRSTQGHERGRSATGVFAQWALAAAAAVAIAGAAYLFVENRRLRDEVSQTQALRSEVEQSARGLRTELEQERSTNAAIRDELTRLRESLQSLRVPPLRPLVLLPLRRGGSQTATVTLPSGAQQVPFRLRLESDDFPRYEAALRDPATGQAVWRSGRLAARADGPDRYVELQVPAALLKQQNYTLELAGRPPTGGAELVSSYAFRIKAG
jgi:hypothetical protein